MPCFGVVFLLERSIVFRFTFPFFSLHFYEYVVDADYCYEFLFGYSGEENENKQQGRVDIRFVRANFTKGLDRKLTFSKAG